MTQAYEAGENLGRAGLFFCVAFFVNFLHCEDSDNKEEIFEEGEKEKLRQGKKLIEDWE